MFRTIAIVAGAAVSIAAMSGCAVKALPYTPSISTVSTLKANGTAPVRLGAFSVKAGTANADVISLRGNSMSSSIGTDYAAYLGEALRQEVELAGRLDPKANLEISGVLLRNELEAGISTGTAAVEGQFVVRRNGEVRYDKVKRGSKEWESSFAGPVALPKAIQNYPLTVQALLTELYADPEFQAALR